MRLTPPYTARVVEFDEDNLTTTSNYAIIKVNEKYSPELLTFYLNSEYIKKQIYKFSEQTSIKVINISHIKNFEIKEIEDPNNLYTQLIKTYNEKKTLIEKQLKLEEDLIEEIIFGEQ